MSQHKLAEITTALTIRELRDRFMDHAETYYRKPSGRPTGHHRNMDDALRPLVRLYGDLPVSDLTPNPGEGRWGMAVDALENVRRAMIADDISRVQINARIGRIRQVFRWAARRRLVPVTVLEEMRTLEPLRRGRSPARETSGVRPVDVRHVEATLPELPSAIADMIRIIMHTGMRVSEARLMRTRDLDMSRGDVWVYRPAEFKTDHLDNAERFVAIGPAGIRVLTFRIPLNPDRFVFSPCPDARRPYHKSAVLNRVRRAALRAGVPHWCPLQLRHTFATRVRSAFGAEGLDYAAACLGHRDVRTSQIYAELDRQRAVEAARKLG